MIDLKSLFCDRHRILVVDDERDVHLLSHISLKSLTYDRRGVEILTAGSAEEALRIMVEVPNIAVVLLDLVMEDGRSGLDLCRRIRGELRNHLVRLVLRTGQSGKAPEREILQTYDIDGYLPKAELTAARLFSSVRTSLKAFYELARMEKDRQAVQRIDHSLLALRPYQSLESMLERIVGTVSEVLYAEEVAMLVRLSGVRGGERDYTLMKAEFLPPLQSELRLARLQSRAAVWMRECDAQFVHEGARDPEVFEDGLLTRFVLDHGLGEGWIFVKVADRDRFSRQCLGLIGRHAAGCLYGAAAQRQIDASNQAEVGGLAI